MIFLESDHAVSIDFFVHHDQRLLGDEDTQTATKWIGLSLDSVMIPSIMETEVGKHV